MKKQPLCVQTVVCLLVVFLLAPPALAWWSQLKPKGKPIHSMLTRLSRETLQKYGLWYEHEAKKGSSDPDDKTHLQAAFTHQQTMKRARDSICAALKPWFKGNKEWAARRLVRGFHYLQDRADPTDQIKGGRRIHVRQLAYELLSQEDLHTYNRGQWKWLVQRYRRVMENMSYRQVMEQSGKFAEDIGNKINELHEQFNSRPQDRDRLVKNELLKMMACIQVSQDRLITLFAAERARQARGESELCDPVDVDALKKDGYSRCQRYADTAVAQQERNLDQQCGYSGSRWSKNRQGHLNWCKNVLPDAPEKQTELRENSLKTCAENNARCRPYAKKSVSQQERNLDLKCGYTGRSWSKNYDGHFRWCRSAPVEFSANWIKKRDDLLTTCAEKNARCKPYAEKAVSQQERNLSQKCGYTGGAWSKGYRGHFNWCWSVSAEAPGRQSEMREEQLRICAEKNARCKPYAEKAVSQQERNLSQKCGYTGGAWSKGYQGHFNWCWSVSAEAPGRQTEMREKQLKTCADKNARCKPYASTAVSQQRRNLSQKCGYTGGAWSINYDGHFNWCWGVSQKSSDGQTEYRNRVLKECAERKNK
ncbi:hypothetical protein [Dethiosulfatarculus sandiegensis]|uniref:Uncharacterized protein n=1 Tax=Dethiosulfatarculus sandiegensis TaxID=1429043 RepID=A0A0D2JY11_9BACT|nr:hypothetical protein [Dethiosulfatarculus sandiegensis]KIX14445.1 hypothetical protein X474_10045 [Dethiosulfatarculus sandiegensis]